MSPQRSLADTDGGIAGQRPMLTVAMPAFNESANLECVVEGTRRSLVAAGVNYEILVVDDGSTDGTSEIAEVLAARHPEIRTVHHHRNLGFSAAWKACVSESRGEWVFVGPSDGQVHPDAAIDFFHGRGTSDVVVGVRRIRHRSPHRRLLSWTFHLVTQVLLGLPVRDFSFCFLFRGDLVRSLRTRSRPRAATILPELLFLAYRQSALLAEREVDVLPRRSGEAKGARPAVVIQTSLELLRLALLHRLVPALTVLHRRSH